MVKAEKNILVIGGAGFIGSHLCRTLSRKNHTIWCLNRPGSTPPAIPNCTWLPYDLKEPLNTEKLPDTVDVIVHLAQSMLYREFPADSIDVFGVNTKSTLDFLDYGYKIGIKQFIYASSGGVYGFGQNAFSETDRFNESSELNFYHTTKYASELLIKNYSNFFSCSMLRFFFVYGPGYRENMLIPRLIESVKNKNPITLDGEDGIKINPIYVGDAVETIERIMEKELSVTLNVGGKEVLSLRAIGEIIGETVGVKPVFKCSENKVAKHLIGDITRMSEILSLPKISFAEGLMKMLENNE